MTTAAPPAIDLSLDGWVCQLDGDRGIIGKLGMGEEALRAELVNQPFRAPVVTLFPVYILVCHICFVQVGPGKMTGQPLRQCDTPERILFKGGKRRPRYVQLTNFEFLSEKDEADRRLVVAEIEKFERDLRLAECGIQAAT